jgi:hypothetical protein
MEFIRRYLQHVLPTGFMKIRYYGFMGSGSSVTMDDIGDAEENLNTGTVSVPMNSGDQDNG